MYSLKKTILSILIGIAAAGVATADDTSPASSVSLSLSLTNVVTSNKAGKQPKAGKQVKAAVSSKAVKAKAIKYDNSLSSSYSMSYGPDDSDSSPDYDPGLRNLPPDLLSIKAGLQFGVSPILSAIQEKYNGLLIREEFTIFTVANVESISNSIINTAGATALARGELRIELCDIEAAVTDDFYFKRLLDGVTFDYTEDDVRISDVVITDGLYKNFKRQNYVDRISNYSMIYMSNIVFYLIKGIAYEAEILAVSIGTCVLSLEIAEDSFINFSGLDLNEIPNSSTLYDAFLYGQTAAALYASNA